MTLELKSNAFNDLSLRSTKRILEMCEDTRASAVKTLANLDHQGDQLSSIERRVGILHADLKTADEKLSNAVLNRSEDRSKCCGLDALVQRIRTNFNRVLRNSNTFVKLGSSFNRGKNPSNSRTTCKFSNGNKKTPSSEALPRHRIVDNTVSTSRTFSEPVLCSRTGSQESLQSCGASPTADRTELEIEDNFTKITNIVGNLKQMSLDINTELISQNRQTGRLVKKISVNRCQVDQANRKADLLLR